MADTYGAVFAIFIVITVIYLIYNGGTIFDRLYSWWRKKLGDEKKIKENRRKNEEKPEILVITEMSMRGMSKSTFIKIVSKWVSEQIIEENKKRKIIQGCLFKRVRGD